MLKIIDEDHNTIQIMLKDLRVGETFRFTNSSLCNKAIRMVMKNGNFTTIWPHPDSIEAHVGDTLQVHLWIDNLVEVVEIKARIVE